MAPWPCERLVENPRATGNDVGAEAIEVAGEDVGTGLANARGRVRKRSRGAIIFIMGWRVRLAGLNLCGSFK